ncbi:MAG: arginine--tRNA ligase, partial [Candidatus Micrarchaeota archaeon]|nr:arginine--tRNA ligase [Candidatus Micrarchaeota archaeon]
MGEDWKNELAQALAAASGCAADAAARSLVPPSAPICDWCSTLAFAAAKERKASPVALAVEWSKALQKGKPAFVARVEAKGPYLNFHFTPSFWSNLVSMASGGQALAGAKTKPLASGKVLIEFPSVNPNKPWHVGHLRNALLGDSIARLLAAAGKEVEREDYIDDLGLQVAQSVWGQHHLPQPRVPAGSEAFAKKLDHVLGWQYVEVAKQVADPIVEAEVRKLLHTLEEGASKESSHARAVVEGCVKAQYQTAFDFGIRHDVLVFESDIVRTIFKEGMEKIKASGAVVTETAGKNAGCLVVKLVGEPGFEGMENADKVLIRSDGTATYTGKDVVFQLWKFGLLEGKFAYAPFVRQPDGTDAMMTAPHDGQAMGFGGAQTVVNVIGQEQAYPQRVIAAVMRKMGYSKQAGASIHLAYEHVVLPEGRFSGREGTWMAGHQKEGAAGKSGSAGEAGADAGGSARAGDEGAASRASSLGFTADELLAEAQARAMQRVREEYKHEQKLAISKAVAVGAIRFAFLRVSAGQKITFDYDQALSLTGDSGPYVMYAYARCAAILRKAKEAGIAATAPVADYAYNEQELSLLRLHLRWPGVVAAAAGKYEVHPIAEFAVEAAGSFNQMYTTTP